MKGLILARDWLLLGAEAALAASAREIADGLVDWSIGGERWAALREQLRLHSFGAADDPIRVRLCERLGLSDAAYWLVLLVATVEVYPEAAAAASLLAEDERIHLLTPVTAARLLRAGLEIDFLEGLGQALEGGAARRLGFFDGLDVLPGWPLSAQGLRLRAAELDALVSGGADLGVPRVASVTRVEPAADPAYRTAQGAAELLRARGFVALRCESRRSGRQFALDIAGIEQKTALFVAVSDALPELGELGRMRSEGVCVLDLVGWPGERAFPISFVERVAALLPATILLIGNTVSTGPLVALAVPRMGRAECQRVWAQLSAAPADREWLAARFRVNLEEARLALREARDQGALEGAGVQPSAREIGRAVLSQGARRMGRAVTLVKSNGLLSDLVVPPALTRKLLDIVSWFKVTTLVELEYGLSTTAQGNGLSCLFAGPPGTGKTFAAQCIANELGLNLYRIDLSQVVSKYIGETEKALAEVFDEAEAGHGVLLFDEADALFGKRTEVKEAHDRYANVEVGYLLQRLESFSGIAVLTTNLRNNLDPAFARRLRFVLEFPLPDAGQRHELWERSLPGRHMRQADLDVKPFADRFRLCGGHIRNIGVAAAHLAAATDAGVVGPNELVRATQRELEKAGLARSASEFGPLAAWLPGKEG